jgi:hypothetical protein
MKSIIVAAVAVFVVGAAAQAHPEEISILDDGGFQVTVSEDGEGNLIQITGSGTKTKIHACENDVVDFVFKRWYFEFMLELLPLFFGNAECVRCIFLVYVFKIVDLTHALIVDGNW